MDALSTYSPTILLVRPFIGLPMWSQLVKNLPAMWVDLGSIPGLGRSPGEGTGYPLQHSGHGVAQSWIRLSDFHFISELIVE